MTDGVSNVFDFAGEDVISWQNEGSTDRDGNYGCGYDHSYVLIFQKPET